MGTLNLKTASGGSVILNPTNTAVDVTITVPASNATMLVSGTSLITLGTARASTSGATIDFTGIPSWAKRITVMFNGVSTNGASLVQVQIGSGSFSTSGYASVASITSAASVGTTVYTGVLVSNASTMANLRAGHIVFATLGSNMWVASGIGALTDVNYTWTTGSTCPTLGSALDRVRITTVNGTDTFDAGSINILYE
jgi:hypothetical protein